MTQTKKKPAGRRATAPVGGANRVARQGFVAREAARPWWSWWTIRRQIPIVLTVLVGVTLLQYHAAAFASPAETTFGPALVVSAVLLAASTLAVYTWPTRTPRWRTIAWVYVLSAGFGAFAFLLFRGRAGLYVALVAGLAVLTLRLNENGRRWWNAKRQQAMRPLYSSRQRKDPL